MRTGSRQKTPTSSMPGAVASSHGVRFCGESEAGAVANSKVCVLAGCHVGVVEAAGRASCLTQAARQVAATR